MFWECYFDSFLGANINPLDVGGRYSVRTRHTLLGACVPIFDFREEGLMGGGRDSRQILPTLKTGQNSYHEV